MEIVKVLLLLIDILWMSSSNNSTVTGSSPERNDLRYWGLLLLLLLLLLLSSSSSSSLLLLLLTSSHCSASTCWETFTYPRLLVGLSSVRGRKFTLSSKVKGSIQGTCLLYDAFVIVLFFAPLLRCLWFNLCFVAILGSCGDHSFRWDG